MHHPMCLCHPEKNEREADFIIKLGKSPDSRGVSQSSLWNLSLARKLRKIIEAKLLIPLMEKLRLREKKEFAQSICPWQS